MTRSTIEARLPCPVCLGVMLAKTRVVGRPGDVVLDTCARCGGVWFELGEVQRLRAHPPSELWRRIKRREETFRGLCHHCQAVMDRNDPRCSACGTENRINCPSCDRPLAAETHDGLRLDVCRHCKGVWFDHVELDALWRMSLDATRARHADQMRGGEVGAWILLDSLMYTPDLLFLGAHAAGMAVETGASVLTNAPDAVAGMAEVAGEAAGGVFEAILEIIGGIFS